MSICSISCLTCNDCQYLTLFGLCLADICPPVLCPNLAPSTGDEVDGKLPGTDGKVAVGSPQN